MNTNDSNQKPGSLLSGYALHVYNLQNQSENQSRVSTKAKHKRALGGMERSVDFLKATGEIGKSKNHLLFKRVISLKTFSEDLKASKNTAKTSKTMGPTTMDSPLFTPGFASKYNNNLQMLVKAKQQSAQMLNAENIKPENDTKRSRLKH